MASSRTTIDAVSLLVWQSMATSSFTSKHSLEGTLPLRIRICTGTTGLLKHRDPQGFLFVQAVQGHFILLVIISSRLKLRRLLSVIPRHSWTIHFRARHGALEIHISRIVGRRIWRKKLQRLLWVINHLMALKQREKHDATGTNIDCLTFYNGAPIAF